MRSRVGARDDRHTKGYFGTCGNDKNTLPPYSIWEKALLLRIENNKTHIYNEEDILFGHDGSGDAADDSRLLRGDSHRSYPPTPVNNGEGIIRLALGGAVGKTTKTRADEKTIEAEDNEKTVESLYAVLFKDAAVSDDQTEKEDDSADLFFKAINVTDSIYHDNDSVRFKVSSGDYQICFVANPSADLFDGLTAGSSKVSDFKALVETKAPDTKPGMLMTSDFHKATVSTNDSININTVTLERAMARIDIVNKADGITIDSVKLVNRATQSILINDSEKNAEALKDTTYKAINLAGKADGTAAYKARIYSYEQYGTETDGNAPSMEVYYSIGTKNYTHKIDFKNSDGNQINLKRNYLYTVNITNNAGKLTFTLSVADWNKGTVFEVTSSDLIDGFDSGERSDYDHSQVGDVMLNDGTLIKNDFTLTDEQKENAIGIVVYKYGHVKNGVKNALTTPHGIVLALKNAGSYVWSSNNSSLGNGNTSSTLSSLYTNIYDGYAAYQSAKANSSNYPAICSSATTYASSCGVPNNTTGWYLPSMGEWIDILGTDGIGGVDVSSVKSASTYNSSVSGGATTAIKNLNEALAKVGEGKYDAFTNTSYWSSSENNNYYAYYMNFKSDGSLVFAATATKNTSQTTRCVLAF